MIGFRFPLAALVRTKRGETAWRVESSSGMIPQPSQMRLHSFGEAKDGNPTLSLLIVSPATESISFEGGYLRQIAGNGRFVVSL